MNMAKLVHPYMMGIQPMVYIGVYSTGFCFVLFFFLTLQKLLWTSLTLTFQGGSGGSLEVASFGF